jgi:hypothetical protein
METHMCDRNCVISVTPSSATLATCNLVHGQATRLAPDDATVVDTVKLHMKRVKESGTYMEMLKRLSRTPASALLPQSVVVAFLQEHLDVLPVDRGAVLCVVHARGVPTVVALMQARDELTTYTRATPLSSKTVVSAEQPMYFLLPA